MTTGKGDKKMSKIRASFVLCCAVFFASCASTPQLDPTDTSRSVIFGYIDMDDAPTSMDWISIKNYKKARSYYNIRTEDGLFFHVAAAPGTYRIVNFGGSGFMSGSVRYPFPAYGNEESTVSVKSPGTYYLGSHKYIEVDTGFFGPEKFKVQRIEEPTEKALLKKILAEIESDFSEFEHAIRLVKERLKQLE